MNNNFNIILVDDEVNIRRSISACLESDGYHVTAVGDPVKAFHEMQESSFDIAIIDIRLGAYSGIALFNQMKKESVDIPVIFISGNASLAEAVESVKIGAYDFIEKPFSSDKLLIAVKNCVEHHQLKQRLKDFEAQKDSIELIGEHNVITQLRTEISKVAQTDAVIFINGESGTGKELIAQSIHACSPRKSGAFVKVNCSAIPENLIDSALFGHVKGAFTGAVSHKKGYFEMADNGTLFLDEIGDMPLSSQASLLRALESREIQKVGSDQITKVNVRVIAASHKDLKREVDLGNFREDLYYRISVIPLYSPALRDRTSDIPLLANHLSDAICLRNGIKAKNLDASIYPIFKAYPWPGNVRELQNTLERMIILGGEKLDACDIPAEIQLSSQSNFKHDETLSLKEYRQRAEREFIIQKLKNCKGNVTQVSKVLGVDRTHLHKKMALYNIERESYFN